MISTTKRLACLTVLLTMPVAANAAPGQPAARTRPTGQVRHLERANITMTATQTYDGGIEVRGSGDDLAFRKTIRPNGTFTLEIESGKDKVVLETAAHGVVVARNGKRASFAPASDDDGALDRVSRLLADSRAVRRLRLAGALTLESDDVSPPAAALLLGDAAVGMLTGDAGAPARIGRHLTKGLRSRLRNVGQSDCYYSWEQSVLAAMNELDDCIMQTAPWSISVRLLCSLRWYLMVESYWISFLTCSGLNW